MNTTDKLNRYADMQAQADVIRMHFDALRGTVITPEIQQALDDIAAEERTSLDSLQAGIAALEAEIKADVLAGGVSVKGEYYQAMWAKGRVSWDTTKLDGLMIAVPQLAQLRKEGAPSVSLRAVK